MLALVSIALGAHMLVAADAWTGGVVEVQADGKLRPVGELDPQLAAKIPVCAAVASDQTTGAVGNGDAETRTAAVDGAMTECRGAGGKECRITSVACDPTRSSD